MRRSAAAGVVAAATMVLVAGCSGSPDPGASGSGSSQGDLASGGVFTIALPSDPGNLDPSMTPSSVARSILGLSYDTLVYQQPDGSFVSGVAEKWSATPTVATFTLKAGVTCSDGTPLTAKDVADNISYIADPKNASPLLDVMVHQGTTTKADDAARTVTVTSPSPNGFLLTELSGVFLICRAGLADHKALETKTIGSGPWNLSQAVANDRYEYTKHTGYTWGPGGSDLTQPGTPDSVTVRVIPNVTTTANLIASGEVNFGTVTGPDAARLQALNLPSADIVDTTGETWFNEASGRPGADPAVREALTIGVDVAAVGKIATGGNAIPSKGYITLQPNPCGVQDNFAGAFPSADVEKAKSVLDAAGYKLGADGVRSKNGTPLAIAFRYDQKGQDARGAGAEYLASQWKALGVKVDMQALPEAQLNNLFFGTGAWDVAWANFTFNLPSQMVAFVSGPTVPNGANFPSIDNKAYNTAAQAATPKVGTEGCPDWAAADKALLAGFNPVPMFDSVTRSFIRKAEITSVGGQIWGATLRLRTA